MKAVDLIGEKFGKLLVIKLAGKNKWGNLKFECQCDCGKKTIILSGNLRNGNSTTCGDCRGTHKRTGSREFVIYHNMKQRCLNPKATEYNHYGGRGIKICDRWLESFKNFLDDMGSAPSEKYSLDRIDNNDDYTPSNCKWSTSFEQSNNRSNNIMINDSNLKLWCRQNNMNYDTIRSRIKKYGWSIEDAINTPIRKRSKI